MGNRVSILVKDNVEQVCLYSHWNGTDMPETVRKALVRGESRWDHLSYLARIIFCEMVPASEWEDTLSFGISTVGYEEDWPLIVVNTDKQTVQIGYKRPVPFSKFVALKKAKWGRNP